jgi:isoleucyl-tRNA synthetase
MEAVRHLILSEVNVKGIDYLSGDDNILVKKIKPNFKTLGPKYGKLMKQIACIVETFDQAAIAKIEIDGSMQLEVQGENIELLISDVEIITDDIPGWVVASSGNLTVALDITVTEELRQEGIARELINRIQNLRKEKGFDVTDKINVRIEKNNELAPAIEHNMAYICSETLASSLTTNNLDSVIFTDLIDITDEIKVKINIEKVTF